jgi:hypothetical protein
MSGFFTPERFGRPQFLAGLLLVVFLGECGWLVSRRRELDDNEISRLRYGLTLWGKEDFIATPYAPLDQSEALQHPVAGHDDVHHSQMWYLIASAPLVLWPVRLQPASLTYLQRLSAMPYLVFGALLGASIWYVSRRLYGNAGGYIALTLYCFSPAMIRASALWNAQPEIGAAWGTFGAIFTAIAVAHTLYAPREVVLWNWRRIVLLGLSLALAVGSQFSLLIVVPVALAFMLYLAPARKSAAVAIWAASCGLGFLLLFASYFFHVRAFWEGMTHATFFGVNGRAFAMTGAYHQVLAQLGHSSPALVLALPAALVIYLAWPRSRYFGNTAPLLVAVLFLFFGLGTPHYPGLGFQLMVVPFLFVFVAGIFADLLETRQRLLVMACVWGLLGAYALWSLLQLSQVG